MDTKQRILGSLLGGAIGDALGAPVEFMKLWMIQERFGSEGVREYARAYGRLGAITDDTQMTLFTAEGLIRAHNRWTEWGRCNVASVVYRAYKRWLQTQERNLPPEQPDGYLAGCHELYARRAPGNTCLSALSRKEMGTPTSPINHSKGCGGVMRVAPAGMTSAEPFALGCEVAAITHSHPSGWLSAGFLSMVVAMLLDGNAMQESLQLARGELIARGRQDIHVEVLAAVDNAIRLAADGQPTFEKVESLGEGWVAEEALAIAIYAVLTAEDDFERAMALAVTHSGDSDSTGAIAGNLLGAILGAEAIPKRYLEGLELRDVIIEIGNDLYAHFWDPDFVADVDDRLRYPGH